MNKFCLVTNEKLSVDLVINNEKAQKLFSKRPKSSKICFS